MAGLRLGTGVGGSVVGGLYGGYGAGSAVPAPAGIPEGPRTITEQAYGVPSVTSGTRVGLHAAGIGTIALGLLAFIWWALPR